MAAATPPARRRALWWVLGAVALLLLFGLALLLAVMVARPQSTGATPALAPTASPTPAPSPGDARTATDSAGQHAQYRAYVSTVVEGGTAVIDGLVGLEGCRVSREDCMNRLGDASAEVGSMREGLTAAPAPACLSAADQRLQDALSFQQRGLDTTRNGVHTQDRVRLVQGMLLTGAGLWRAGQAISDGRRSNC